MAPTLGSTLRILDFDRVDYCARLAYLIQLPLCSRVVVSVEGFVSNACFVELLVVSSAGGKITKWLTRLRHEAPKSLQLIDETPGLEPQLSWLRAQRSCFMFLTFLIWDKSC